MLHNTRCNLQHLSLRQRKLFYPRKPKHPKPIHRKNPPQTPRNPTKTIRSRRIPSIPTKLCPLQRANLHVNIPKNPQLKPRRVLHNVHADASEHPETQRDIQGRVQRGRSVGGVCYFTGPVYKLFGGEEECRGQAAGVCDLSRTRKAGRDGD